MIIFENILKNCCIYTVLKIFPYEKLISLSSAEMRKICNIKSFQKKIAFSRTQYDIEFLKEIKFFQHFLNWLRMDNNTVLVRKKPFSMCFIKCWGIAWNLELAVFKLWITKRVQTHTYTYCYEFVNIVCKICIYYLFLNYNISDAREKFIFGEKARDFS